MIDVMKNINIYMCIAFSTFLIANAQQQEFINQIDKNEKQYLQFYFDAEKHKVLEEYEQALMLYEKCTALNPEESSAYNEIAKLYFYFKEWDNAEYYIKRAIDINGKNRWYYYLLLDIYIMQNKMDEQIDVYSNLIQIEPSNPIYYFQKIQILRELSLYKRAIKFIKKTESKLGESDDLSLELKNIFLDQNNFEKAEKTIQYLLKKHPSDPRFLSELASVYLHFSKYEKAISVYNDLLVIDKNNATAIIALYKIYANKKDIVNQEIYLLKIVDNPIINIETKKDIFYKLLIENNISEHASFQLITEKAIKLYPNEPIFNLILADIYAKEERYMLAIPHYNRSLNSGLIKDEYVYTKLIEIYFLQKDFDLALNTTNLAISRYPYNARLYYYKGLSHFNKNEYNETIEALLMGQEFIIDEPLFKSEFFSLIGDSYHKLGSDIQSDEAYRTALLYNEQNIYVLNNYSYYLALRGENLKTAKDMIVKCNELTADNPNPSFLDTYAWVLYKLEEYNLAKTQIMKAIDLQTNSATLFDHYGDILEKLGLFNDALVQWKKSLSINPDDSVVKDKIKIYE
jgi:tetratricopeptide (TPR) repeat protein